MVKVSNMNQTKSNVSKIFSTCHSAARVLETEHLTGGWTQHAGQS